MKDLSIIVPTYNEKDNVNVLCGILSEELKDIDYEIIFVDDSTDETPQIIDEITKKDSRIRCIHRDNEKGLATAVVLGFNNAEGNFLSVMDADLQHPPELIKRMYDSINKGYDICVPSRFVSGGSDGGLNVWRKIVSFSARKIGQIFLRSLRPFSDVTGGVFIIKKECIAGVDLKPLGWKILVEVLAMGNYSKVCEIPYQFKNRLSGESKISLGVTLDYFKHLIGLKGREKKNRKVKVDILVGNEV